MAWAAGSVRGLRARGGFEVAIDWADGALARATVRAERAGPARVRWGHRSIDLELTAGGSRTSTVAELQ